MLHVCVHVTFVNSHTKLIVCNIQKVVVIYIWSFFLRAVLAYMCRPTKSVIVTESKLLCWFSSFNISVVCLILIYLSCYCTRYKWRIRRGSQWFKNLYTLKKVLMMMRYRASKEVTFCLSALRFFLMYLRCLGYAIYICIVYVYGLTV